ncbi:MAG: glycosyltransferase family 39 protein [Chitinophagales bacterium]|nr:glycosyltransferase family 39 protein [Chitinophagales bacterium]
MKLNFKYFTLPFAIVIAVLLYIRLKLVFSYSLDLVGLEYYFIHIVQQLSAGQGIYPNPEALPYANCLYTPVYFYIYRIAVSCLQINVFNDIYILLVLGRILSIIFVMAQIVYLIKFARLFTKSRIIQIAAVAFYLLLITEMMFAVRPDSLKVFFFMVFVYHLLLYVDRTATLKDGIICIAAAAFAVYTKQDISVHISFCFITALLLSRNKKIIGLFSAFLVICGGAFFISIGFYGKYFFHNIVFFNIQSVTNLSTSFNIFFISISIFRTFPFLVLTVLNARILVKSNAHTKEKFICIYAVLLYFLAHLSMLRAGSNFNYTFELIVLLILNLVVFCSIYKNKILEKRISATLTTAFFIFFYVVINGIIGNYAYKSEKEKNRKEEYTKIMESRKEIKETIGNAYAFFPNTLYSVFYIDKHIILGHDMHLDRFIKLYFTFDLPFNIDIKSKLPYINTTEYDKNFTDGTITYVITDNTKKSAEHVAFYYPAYKYYKTIDNMILYKFRDEEVRKLLIKTNLK